MVQYKHKTTGHIAKISDTMNDMYNLDSGRAVYSMLPKEIVENSNDWDLVVEKDFEIVSFRNRENNLLYTLCDGKYKTQNIDGFTDVGDRNLEYCIKFYKIHSVKRLLDNEVFTLGNNLTYNESCSVKIVSLECENSTIRIDTNNGGFYFLKDAEKLKPSLFKTFDGVDIFRENVYWYLSNTDFEIYKCTRADIDFTPHLSFSTEIAAKNYKTENQKRYSLNDIKKAISKSGCFGTTLLEILTNK